MKILVLQETDWIKRGPHQQHHLMDRMALSPVIRECEKRGQEHFILHTGQHYSYDMDRVFFERLGLPEAMYNLEAGSGAQGDGNGKAAERIRRVIAMRRREDPFTIECVKTRETDQCLGVVEDW